MIDSTYAWIIDTDHMPTESAAPGTYGNAIGVHGPSNAPADLLDRLKAGEGVRFRLYDDDEELYYSGRLVTREGDETVTCDAEVLPGWRLRLCTSDPGETDTASFGPLWDFGLPNAGCTELRYQDSTTGHWGSL